MSFPSGGFVWFNSIDTFRRMPIGIAARSRGGTSRPALIGVFLVASCGDALVHRVESASVTTGSLHIHTAYALPPFTDAPMPVYLTIDNTSATPDSLLGVTAPVASHAMLHGGGMEGMTALVLPPNGRLALRPGGTHLMLEPPLPRFGRGDSVQVTLRFAHAGSVAVWATVIDYEDLDRIR
jgi:copper(I)-binding protein